jgi:hypothetical protein
MSDQTVIRVGDTVTWTNRALCYIPIQARVLDLVDVAPRSDGNDVVPGAELEVIAVNGATTSAGTWRNEFAPLTELELAND